MSEIAVIAIGRNEGQRLRRCLESVVNRGYHVIYVDSGSTDGSVELATSLGAQVVTLDMSIPFSAARARNAGVEHLGQSSLIEFVQFVDGDCEIVAGWLDTAKQELETRFDVAVVCGRRRERHPEHSIYNRLADIEWNTPVGEALSCGGDAMMRLSAFREAGGFDPSIVAGEEPELCQRLRERGHRIVRIDAEMTLHDSAITHFSQWWKRQIRSGYGSVDVFTRFGKSGLFARQVQRARDWTMGILFSMVVIVGLAIFIGVRAGPKVGFAVGVASMLIFGLILPLQMLRTAFGIRKKAGDLRTAIAYGFLTMISKWPEMIGQLRYARDRKSGKHLQLIEYKTSPTHA